MQQLFLQSHQFWIEAMSTLAQVWKLHTCMCVHAQDQPRAAASPALTL